MFGGYFAKRNITWKQYDVILIGLLLAILCVMILPVPTFIMDALLATNLTLAVCILMVSVYLQRPLEFSTFPVIILLFTAFRISLSVATTRLILLDADAGDIIKTFGEFVVQGNVVVGLVIFLIITTVQFLVVTKGAERIAEVSARFTLDSMPGKQMSIEADIRSGDLTRAAGRTKRDELSKESQFFGAMDGAMKFVKGDAIAGLIIIIINLIGGISIGVAQKGMSFGDAIQVYSLLTVGDGLVAQIPALFIALCAGMVVTRVTSDKTTDLGADIVGQVTANRRGVIAASAIVFIIGFLPGFPTIIFVLLSFGLALIAIIPARQKRLLDALPVDNTPMKVSEDHLEQMNDRMILEISEKDFDDFDWQRFTHARSETLNRLVVQNGYMVPWVGIKATPHLAAGQAQISLDRVPIVFLEVVPKSIICYGEKSTISMISNTEKPEVADASFGPSFCLMDRHIDGLKDGGILHFRVEEALFRLTHQTMLSNLNELLSKDAVRDYLEDLQTEDAVKMDAICAILPNEVLHNVFHRLMVEMVPLYPHYVVIETLLDWSKREADPVLLAEYVRQGLRRQIAYSISSGKNQIASYLVDAEMDKVVRDAVQMTAVGGFLALDAADSSSIVEEFSRIQANATGRNIRPAIIAANDVRRFLQRFLARNNIILPVIAQQELCIEFEYRPLGIARLRTKSN